MAQRANNTDEGGKPLSVADIAATLLSKPAQEQVPTGEDLDTDTDELEGDEVGSDEGEEDGQGPDDLDQDEGDEQEEDEPTDEDDEADYLDIRDDDLITVVVDGEEQEVSIGALKKAFSGEGAIDKRLQEATELRKAANAERVQMLEQLAAQQRTLEEALTSLDGTVFAPVIPEPSQQLRRSNPEQYLRHKEAYDADQKRIATAKKAVQDKITQLSGERDQRLAEFARQASQIIVQEIPELSKPNEAPAMFAKLADTARYYGYTDVEIQTALDPRMFILMRDATRYRELKAKTNGRSPTNLEGQQQKKVRRLRSGNTQAKNRVRQADKQRKAVTETARKTGKVADVAKTLLVPRG